MQVENRNFCDTEEVLAKIKLDKQLTFIGCYFENIDFDPIGKFGIYFGIYKDICFVECDFVDCNFRNTRFIQCTFQQSNIRSSNLNYTTFEGCSFIRTDLLCVEFKGATFKDTKFVSIDFQESSFDADSVIVGCTFEACFTENMTIGAMDVSGTTIHELPNLEKHFEFGVNGLIAYKAESYLHTAPDHWKFEPGAELTETVCTDVFTTCGSGVNVGSKEWIRENIPLIKRLWKVIIPYTQLPFCVIPLPFEGKIRTPYCKLIERIDRAEL